MSCAEICSKTAVTFDDRSVSRSRREIRRGKRSATTIRITRIIRARLTTMQLSRKKWKTPTRAKRRKWTSNQTISSVSQEIKDQLGQQQQQQQQQSLQPISLSTPSSLSQPTSVISTVGTTPLGSQTATVNPYYQLYSTDFSAAGGLPGLAVPSAFSI
ncbi:hypothetical protein OESDEN_21082, partial [Oesophagostomum dentatum]